MLGFFVPKRDSRVSKMATVFVLPIFTIFCLFAYGTFAFNNQSLFSKSRVEIQQISADTQLVDFNNVVAESKSTNVKKSINKDGFKYTFLNPETNEKMFSINSAEEIKLPKKVGLSAGAVTIGCAIASGGAVGAATAVATAARGVRTAQTIAWLTRGSLSAISTLRIAAAAALTANPVGAVVNGVILA